MKAAIIGASAESLHTIEVAKKHGITVIALDGNEKAEGLKKADISKVVNISKEESTLQALEQQEIDFVLTAPIGRYLTTIGYVNDALQLPGIGKEAAVLCTDKWLFHQKMAENGLRDCLCLEVKEDEGSRRILYLEIEKAGEEALEEGSSGEEREKTLCSNQERMISFPAILKPRFGSGSRGIYVVNTTEELQKAFQATTGEAYVLEECVAGEEYGMDGAVVEGKFYPVLLRHKENTPLPARQAVAYFSVMPQEQCFEEVKSLLEKAVKVLGLKECLLHADIVMGEQGPFVIEMSARPSGHHLHNLFTPLCTGVDVAEEYIKYRTGKTYSFEPVETRQMMIHYFDMKGKVKQVPDRNDVEKILGIPLVTWECHIARGDLLEEVLDGHSLMGRGFFVLEGKSEEELRKQAEKIKGLFY